VTASRRSGIGSARRERVRRSVLAVGLTGMLLSACSRPSLELEPGSYRAMLEIPGGKSVPFGLDVAREENGFVLYLLNGDERVRVPEVQAAPGTMTVRMPGYENVLHATIRGGQLSGRLTLVHPDGKVLELPFHAQLGQTWRFHENALHDNADLQGRWQVTLTGRDGRGQPGIAEFVQRFAAVTGTVVTPDGDQRYLAGDVRDETLKLSRFDGGAVLLYDAKLDGQGRLIGEAWDDREGTRRFVASRNADADFGTIFKPAALSSDSTAFQFSARDLDGQIVTEDDPRFAGKVLLVTVTGSWCPKSRDEVAPLERLGRQYRDRGLEVVALLYEQHGAFEPSAAAVQRFREASRVTYPMLVAGQIGTYGMRGTPAPLVSPLTVPTWLIVDRSRRVVRVQPGFIGPAAGTAHELMMREVERALDAALAEPSPVTVSPGNS
jgi:hypothetical protein